MNAANPEERKPVTWVAIYTRKSGDENMNGAVTSIDSQKAACRAYIQIHQERGWQEYPEAFDDPAESGKNLDRPAAKRLLRAVREGGVQVVIVYKLDRLTRSSKDFHQLVELFEKRNVGLVSATESIDTKSPQGRLMTCIMVQFAQYDRELDQERSRDFHLARARRGLWCGGLPPLGYDCKDKQLVVNEAEVEVVRFIFDLYLRFKSAERVALELNRRGLRRKLYRTKAGRPFGGKAFNMNSVRRILKRKFYVGRIANERTGLEFPAQHRAIIPPEVFSDVLKILDERDERGEYCVNKNGYLLKGLAQCGLCGSALKGYSRPKKKKLYRYYRCALQAAEGSVRCGFTSIIADRLEAMVLRELEAAGRNRAYMERLIQAAKRNSRVLAASLEEDERVRQGKLDEVKRDIDGMRKLVETNPRLDAVAIEIRKLELVRGELEASIERLRARIADTRPVAGDAAAAQEALQGLGRMLKGLSVPRQIEVLRTLVRRTRVWRNRVELDLNELAVADIKRALGERH